MYQRVNKKRSIRTTIGEKSKKLISLLTKNNTWATSIIEGKLGKRRPRQVIYDANNVISEEKDLIKN